MQFLLTAIKLPLRALNGLFKATEIWYARGELNKCCSGQIDKVMERVDTTTHAFVNFR